MAAHGRRRNSRAGSISNAPSKANTAPTVIPIKRSGSDSNHTTGASTKASSAIGQASTNSRHQPTSNSSAFMPRSGAGGSALGPLRRRFVGLRQMVNANQNRQRESDGKADGKDAVRQAALHGGFLRD